MSLIEKIHALSQRAPALVKHLATEEATKNALVMPFLSSLGYDVFNPMEVVPEFTADVGVKKGEKVDYAILRDEQVLMLVEAKKVGAELRVTERSQLFRYFSVTKARVALLTNGTQYLFFSDLEKPNIMDELPFLEVDLLDLRDSVVLELRCLGKEHFNLDKVLSQASQLKYIGETQRTLAQQLEEPMEGFVRFFFTQANPDLRFTPSAKKEWTLFVKTAFQQFVADKMREQLRNYLEHEDRTSSRARVPELETKNKQQLVGEGRPGVETTEEELEGFRIVRAITRSTIPVKRVGYRDSKAYFAILVDDNNRKPICRLHLNRSTWYLGLFDSEKSETKHVLANLEALYDHSDALRESAARHA